MSSYPSFDVLADTSLHDDSLPAFMVSTSRGFLPREDPIVDLPAEFDPLESILRRMPIKTATGEAGLLASCTLGKHVDEHFPDLTPAIDKYSHNLPLMNALYRDYSFLASAYLLEPCHERFMRGESYGLGRQVLPRQIALPIVKVAEMQVLRYDPPSFQLVDRSAVPASSRLWSTPARTLSSTIALSTPLSASNIRTSA